MSRFARLVPALLLALAVSLPGSARAQTTTLPFDQSNSCAGGCSPFDQLLANYGSSAGVNVTNGALAGFGLSGFTEGLHWYDLGTPPFGGGFALGSGAVGAFIFTAVDPTATITFDQALLSSNQLATAEFRFYDLSDNLLSDLFYSLDNPDPPTNPTGITPANTPLSVVGGFKMEFAFPDPNLNLTQLFVDDVQFTLGPAGSVVPEPATMTLLGLGLVGLVGAGRRKRAR